MESSSTTADVPRSISVSSSRRLNRSNDRLFFDRRYGWVGASLVSEYDNDANRGLILDFGFARFDEWKHPSQEALAGGRGMFCILPLAQGLFKRASDSINLAANFSLKVYENPDLISPQALQSFLDKRLNELKPSIQKPDFSCFAPKGKSSSDSAMVSSRLQIESAGSQKG